MAENMSEFYFGWKGWAGLVVMVF